MTFGVTTQETWRSVPSDHLREGARNRCASVAILNCGPMARRRQASTQERGQRIPRVFGHSIIKCLNRNYKHSGELWHFCFCKSNIYFGGNSVIRSHDSRNSRNRQWLSGSAHHWKNATEAAQGDFIKITAIFCFKNNSYAHLRSGWFRLLLGKPLVFHWFCGP